MWLRTRLVGLLHTNSWFQVEYVYCHKAQMFSARQVVTCKHINSRFQEGGYIQTLTAGSRKVVTCKHINSRFQEGGYIQTLTAGSRKVVTYKHITSRFQEGGYIQTLTAGSRKVVTYKRINSRFQEGGCIQTLTTGSKQGMLTQLCTNIVFSMANDCILQTVTSSVIYNLM